MTEADWDSCTDPAAMLQYLRSWGGASDRRLRLFGVACCRRIWSLLTDGRSRRAVEVAEAYADGLAGLQELQQAYQAGWAAAKEMIASRDADARHDPDLLYGMHDVGLAAPAACAAAYASSPDAQQVDNAGYYARHAQMQAASPFPLADSTPGDAEQVAQGDFLRVKLAQAIYDERRFGDMPVLADAFEEAGCDNEEILRHCRQRETVHVRGCWVLDVLLERA
jgi:hypothetical protein